MLMCDFMKVNKCTNLFIILSVSVFWGCYRELYSKKVFPDIDMKVSCSRKFSIELILQITVIRKTFTYTLFYVFIYLFIYFFACFRRSSQANFFNPAGKVCRNNEWIKSTLMQIWKSANIFVLMWK